MKKRLIFLLLALCLLSSGCTKEPHAVVQAEGVRVYRRLAELSGGGSSPLRAELLPMGKEEPLELVLSAFERAPESPELKNPLPPGVSILSTEQTGSQLHITMNAAYLDLSELEQTLAKACLTLSFCALDGVDLVSIGVGGETIEPRLSAEDFLLFDSVISAEKSQVRLYFPKQKGRSLGSEYKSIRTNGENSLEREVLDALFRGPTHPELKRAFPPGVVAMSVYTINGLCSVSLSGLEPDNPPMGPEEAELAIYSLVNSLFAIPGIKGVQILIEGQAGQELWGIPISAPLTKSQDLIGSSPSGDSLK